MKVLKMLILSTEINSQLVLEIIMYTLCSFLIQHICFRLCAFLLMRVEKRAVRRAISSLICPCLCVVTLDWVQIFTREVNWYGQRTFMESLIVKRLT